MTVISKSLFFLVAFLIAIVLVGCGTSNAPQATNTTVPTQSVEASPTPESVGNSTATEESEAVEETATEETTVETVSNTNADVTTCAKLNLNTLTEDELMSTIPNFSSRMVREFFEYRPYVSIQQFQREIGKYVDDAQVAEYEKYVFVPVDPNNADADTLKQIPGIDDTLAASLIAGRPYASNQAFLDALSKSLDAQQVAEAGCYVVASA